MSTYRIIVTCALSFFLVSSIFLVDVASASDCAAGYGCYFNFKSTNHKIVHHNRKFLMSLMGSQKAEAVDEEKAKYGAEMRNVPAGPDPLHHNNGPPKRPVMSP